MLVPSSVHASRRRPRRAFTLIEAIASITILGTIAAVAAPLILEAGDGYASASTAGQLHVEASVALDRLARSLRSVEQDSGAPTPSPLITSTTDTSIAWGPASGVSLSGARLVLVDDGRAPAVLLDDVADFRVCTFDESNAALAFTQSGTACRVIRRVELTLTTERHGVRHTLRTRVFVRAAAEGSGA